MPLFAQCEPRPSSRACRHWLYPLTGAIMGQIPCVTLLIWMKTSRFVSNKAVQTRRLVFVLFSRLQRWLKPRERMPWALRGREGATEHCSIYIINKNTMPYPNCFQYVFSSIIFLSLRGSSSHLVRVQSRDSRDRDTLYGWQIAHWKNRNACCKFVFWLEGRSHVLVKVISRCQWFRNGLRNVNEKREGERGSVT